MNDARSPRLASRTKLTLVLLSVGILLAFLWAVQSMLTPFLWALVAAYVLGPVVNYFNVRGGMPRIWSVILLYATVALALVAGSRYLYPRILEQSTLFLEDLPRLEASLIDLVGPRPLGVDINALVSQLVVSGRGVTSGRSAGHLLVNAVETFFKLFLFLVATFYLLMDGPRLKRSIGATIPPDYRPELTALGRQISLTWQQYIRGELLLFAIMATVTTIGLTALQVPGALFLGIASGALELLPLVGPWTAGMLAVSVAYFNGTNPWNWSQVAYAGVVGLMYLVLRQAEDYIVMPHVLGRAVRLHPLVVLFALTSAGVIAGLFGLVIAVPLAASIKAIASYLYAKLADHLVEFEPVRTLGGGVIEIPIEGEVPDDEEVPVAPGAGIA